MSRFGTEVRYYYKITNPKAIEAFKAEAEGRKRSIASAAWRLLTQRAVSLTGIHRGAGCAETATPT